MSDRSVSAAFLDRARADRLGQTRRHADQCVLLALVTSTDVAATLIDQAVALRATMADRPRAA